MWQSLVGRRSRPVVNWVERGAVRRFAEAIGDPNPLYLDEEAAQKSRYGPIDRAPHLSANLRLRNHRGASPPGQRFDPRRTALRLRSAAVCRGGNHLFRVFQEMYEKRGRRGRLTFLVFSRVGEDRGGKTLFTTKDVIIVTETVMKEWKG